MKTTYYVKQLDTVNQVRVSTHPADVDYLRENYRKPGAELWRITEEDEGEAAIRRMKALDGWHNSKTGVMWIRGETPSQLADRLSPPPSRTEVRVDWDTLEEVKEPQVWQVDDDRLWFAGMHKREWSSITARAICDRLFTGTAAIGPTRETALRNLREMQEARKGKA